MAALKTHLVKALHNRKTAETAKKKDIHGRFARTAAAAQTAAAAAAAGKVPPKAASQPQNGGTRQ